MKLNFKEHSSIASVKFLAIDLQNLSKYYQILTSIWIYAYCLHDAIDAVAIRKFFSLLLFLKTTIKSSLTINKKHKYANACIVINAVAINWSCVLFSTVFRKRNDQIHTRTMHDDWNDVLHCLVCTVQFAWIHRLVTISIELWKSAICKRATNLNARQQNANHTLFTTLI